MTKRTLASLGALGTTFVALGLSILAQTMPPPGVRRPPAETLNAFTTSLETRIDTAAALHATPGRRTFQRLNRAEYQRAVHHLLDLDVDVNAFLPPDTVSAGFDNVADV